jgi:DNA-binding protein YbaB
VVVNGQQDIISIDLNPKYLSSEHAALLQDLLATTINNALTKSRDLQENAMGQLSNELNLPNIPGIFK